jgi:hypothetical protein
MTDARVTDGPAPSLQSGSAQPTHGLEAAPGLISLLPSGDAPVCDGDSCEIPGR